MGIGSPTLNPAASSSLPTDVNLIQVSGAPVTLGQAAMNASLPVVIATNQSALPISGTVTANQGTANATPWNENIAQYGGNNVRSAGQTGVFAIGGADAVGNTQNNNPLVIGLLDAGSHVITAQSASAAAGTVAAGLLGAGLLGWDYVSAYQRVKTDATGNLFIGNSSFAVTQATAANLNATVVGTGTFAVQATLQAASATIVGQVELTDGTNIANIIAPGTGQNAQLVARAYKEVSFTTTTVQAVGTTESSNYAWVSVQITTQGTNSTVTFQGSNDNSTFVNIGLLQSSTVNGSSANSTTNTGIFHGSLPFRYFRLNVTGISAGTTAGLIEFFTQPAALQSLGVGSTNLSTNVNQVGGTAVLTGNGVTGAGSLRVTLASDTTSNTNAFLVAGGKTNNNSAPGATNVGVLPAIANGAIPGWTEGQQVLQSVDLSGNQRTILLGGLMPTGTALQTFAVHLTNNATTAVSVSTSYISCISISSDVAGTTSTITIQDVSATPKKLINGLSTTSLTTTPTTVNFQTPVLMTNGITIVTAGAVAATVDVWISYYL